MEEKFGPVPSMISTQECGWGMSGAQSQSWGLGRHGTYRATAYQRLMLTSKGP